ncbi:suppressor of fused domain protein [Oxalobacteraceae bacterium A2-2]
MSTPEAHAISAHIESHLGPISTVLYETASDTIVLDVHVVAPNERSPHLRLVTCGMSSQKMAVPDGSDAPAYAELMITLPGDWRTDPVSLEDERWAWPLALIKNLARLPHRHQAWMGIGHDIPNGEPPRPYSPDTALCGALVLPAASAPAPFQALELEDGKRIAFYAVVPLHAAEMELKRRAGTARLLQAFDAKGVTDLADPQRADASVKKKWSLW